MTDKFYCAFLDYLSIKEKQSLCGNLQKRNIRVKGFRMTKDIPSKILAPHIARNERSFFKILLECYKPTYADRDAAVDAFSPDTAVLCLTYFVRENIADEDFLNSLFQKASNTPVEPKESTSESKLQKKYEEFRQKYLAAHKEAEHLKKELEAEKKESHRLSELLSSKETDVENLQAEIHAHGIAQNELQQAQRDLEKMKKENQDLLALLSAQDTMISDLRAEIDAKVTEHHETVAALTQCISELEAKKVEHTNTTPHPDRRILILVSDESECVNGANSLPYSKIPQLSEIHEDYTEILFVTNDLPFHLKRRIHKMSDIQSKIHTFSTKSELLEYIEKG